MIGGTGVGVGGCSPASDAGVAAAAPPFLLGAFYELCQQSQETHIKKNNKPCCSSQPPFSSADLACLIAKGLAGPEQTEKATTAGCEQLLLVVEQVAGALQHYAVEASYYEAAVVVHQASFQEDPAMVHSVRWDDHWPAAAAAAAAAAAVVA